MYQIQSIVDRLRIVIASDRIEESPDLRNLATEFRDLTRNLNERLRRCSEFLRQGLRAEAIQAAEVEPRLLDAIGVIQGLSVDELSAWTDRVEFLELPVNEPIATDAAIMLDEAYGEQGPLDRLLRSHRRLALQRAPLPQRLAVIRKLEQEDPNTEFWPIDRKAYEQQRLTDVAALLRAPKRLSLDELLGLQDELHQQNWGVSVPDKLKTRVEQLLASSERDTARAVVEQAAADLHQAHSAFDFEFARPAYSAWQANLKMASLADDDPLVLKTLPALTWFEAQALDEQKEQKWQDHLHEIQIVLDRPGVRLDELERLSLASDRHGRPLPAILQNRLVSTIDSLRARRRNWRIMIGTTIAVVAIALVTAVTIAVRMASENAYRRQIIARIDGFLEKGDIEQAQVLSTQFNVRWEQQLDWIEALSRITELETQLQDRNSQVDELLAAAEAVPDVDNEKFKELTENAVAITQQSPVIDSLQRTTRRRISSLDTERQQRLKQREASVEAGIATLSNQMSQFESVVKEDALKLQEAELNRFDEELEAIAEKANAMGKSFENSIGVLRSKSSTVRANYDQAIRQQAVLDDVRKSSRITASKESIRQIDDYVSNLNGFVKEFPGHNSTAQFQQAASEGTHWKSCFEVPDLAARMTVPQRLSPTALTVQSEEAKRFVNAYRQSPWGESLIEYKANIDVLLERIKAIDSFRNSFLESVEMTGLFVLFNEKTGIKYYVTNRSELSKVSILDLDCWTSDSTSVTVRVNFDDLESPVPTAAPQRELATRLENCFSDLDQKNWEETLGAAIKECVNAKEVDPILRFKLVWKLHGLLAQHRFRSAEEHLPFEKFIEDLMFYNGKINWSTKWAAPNDGGLADRRRSAIEFFAGLAQQDLDAIWPPASDALGDSVRNLKNVHRAVGMMTSEEISDTLIDIDAPKKNEGDWRLFVIAPGNADGSYVHPIGWVRDGIVEVDAVKIRQKHLPGRLVFAELVDFRSN